MNDKELELYIETLINQYSDTVLRLSYSYLKSLEDGKDVTQNVFIKLFTNPQKFKDKNHEKAYILRITANLCKDYLRSAWRKKTMPLDECSDIVAPLESEENSMIFAVNQLDSKYRIVIYLHYYEGYKAREIAKILGVPVATIHTRLVRGRDNLKKILGGNDFETL